MKRVKVLRPFDAYAVGDTPTLFGAVARDRRERGDVEWLDDVSDAAPAEAPAEPFGGKGDHDDNGKVGGAKAPAPRAKRKR